jgi:hypothetical protein
MPRGSNSPTLTTYQNKYFISFHFTVILGVQLAALTNAGLIIIIVWKGLMLLE